MRKLFQGSRHAGLGLFSCNIHCLAQFILLDVLEIGEQDNEKKLHPLQKLVQPDGNLELGNIPLLGHHQQTLDQKTLQELRSNTLEEGEETLIINNVLHDLTKGLEGLAIPAGRGARLQSNLGDD